MITKKAVQTSESVFGGAGSGNVGGVVLAVITAESDLSAYPPANYKEGTIIIQCSTSGDVRELFFIKNTPTPTWFGLNSLLKNDIQTIQTALNLGGDADNIINGLSELYQVFVNLPEDINLLTELNKKLTFGLFANIPTATLENNGFYYQAETGLYKSNGSSWDLIGYNKANIDTLLDLKINTTDIVDNLTSTDTDKPLSANQGKTLKQYVDDQFANNNLWDRSGDDLFAHNPNDNIDLKDGGLKDTNVTTAIHIGDSSNTSLNTTNKTLIGGLNEIHDNISSNYIMRTDIDQAMSHYEALFVDPVNGDNLSATGTRTRPFQTIQAAINSFTAGSPHVIYVNGSTTADITFRSADKSMMIIFDPKTQHSGTITLVNGNTSIYFVANSSRAVVTGTVNDSSKGNIYWLGIYKSGIYNKTGGASDYNVAGYVEFDFASNVDGLTLNLTGNSMVRILGTGAMAGLNQSNGMFVGQFKGSIATPTITGGANPLLGQPICLLQGEIQLIKNGSNKSFLCSASYGLIYLAGISTLQLDFTTFGQVDFTGSGANCFCQVWAHSQLATSGDVFPATGAILPNSALYLNASRTATNYTVTGTSTKHHFDGIDAKLGILGNGTVSVSFTNQNTIAVDHNKGYNPLVQVINNDNKNIDVAIEHESSNRFVVYSNINITGKIIYF